MVLRCRRDGLALAIALFLVLVLHALVAVVVAGLHQDFGALRHADRRTEAYFLARAGVNFALDRLDGADAPSWEAAHRVDDPRFPMDQIPAQADRVVLAGGVPEVRAWIQATERPDVYLVRGASGTGNRPEFASLTAVRRASTTGSVYALELTGMDRPDSLYEMTGPEGGWKLLPPPPAMFWAEDAPVVLQQDGRPDFARLLGLPTGDSQGNVYVVAWPTRIQAPRGEVLYRFDRASGEWGLLPDLPPGARVSGLACGGDRLFVSSPLGGIHRLDDPGAAVWRPDPVNGWRPGAGDWSEIPSPPRAYFDLAGNLQVDAELSMPVAGLTADGQGNLYVRSPLAGLPDSIHRYDAPARAWQILPPPPQLACQSAQGGYAVSEVQAQVNALSTPQADPEGNLYLVWNVRTGDRPDSVFKFVPEGRADDRGVALGQWKLLPPAQLRRYDDSGQLSTYPSLVPSFGPPAVDSGGRLLLKHTVIEKEGASPPQEQALSELRAFARDEFGLLPRDLRRFEEQPDTIYSYDGSSRPSQMVEVLPPIPQKRIEADSSAAGWSEVPGPKPFAETVPFMGAGGFQDPDKVEYVPVTWF